jgi:hypothetical protein
MKKYTALVKYLEFNRMNFCYQKNVLGLVKICKYEK